MDILKELRDIRKAIKDARQDGRITFVEGLLIGKEVLDVLMIVLPLLLSDVGRGQAALQALLADLPPEYAEQLRQILGSEA